MPTPPSTPSTPPPVNRTCIAHLNSILDAADDVIYGAHRAWEMVGAITPTHADILLDTRDEMIRMLACLSDGHPQVTGSYGAVSDAKLARMRFYEAQATSLLRRIPGGASPAVVGIVVANPRPESVLMVEFA